MRRGQKNRRMFYPKQTSLWISCLCCCAWCPHTSSVFCFFLPKFWFRTNYATQKVVCVLHLCTEHWMFQHCCIILPPWVCIKRLWGSTKYAESHLSFFRPRQDSLNILPRLAPNQPTRSQKTDQSVDGAVFSHVLCGITLCPCRSIIYSQLMMQHATFAYTVHKQWRRMELGSEYPQPNLF